MQCLPTGLTVAHNVSMKEWCSVNEWSLEFVTVLFPPPYRFTPLIYSWWVKRLPYMFPRKGGGGNNSSDNKSSSTLWIRALPNTYLWTHEPSWSETLTEAFQISDVIKIYSFSGKTTTKSFPKFHNFWGKKHKKVRKLSKNI